ncbi:hypothetical protein ABTU92_30740, partial [Rhodoplanes sp. SY1]
GAFLLFDDSFYRSVGGMDQRYLLYTEDVDLSWRAWIAGYKVVYEPRAAIIHFSGGRFYREDILSNETFYSLRNFIFISRKYFGRAGELRALNLLSKVHDKALVLAVKASYRSDQKPDLQRDFGNYRVHPMMKITGLNLFHEVRDGD